MHGFLALMTPKNNPLFDVVATTQDGSRSASIQVKTRSVRNTQGWKFGKNIATDKESVGLFIVLVNLQANSLPDFYIYEYYELCKRVSEEYNQYITKPKRDGTARKDVDFRWFDEVMFNSNDNSRKNNWEPIVKVLNQL